jgi:hypothetical protein
MGKWTSIDPKTCLRKGFSGSNLNFFQLEAYVQLECIFLVHWGSRAKIGLPQKHETIVCIPFVIILQITLVQISI